jgi:4-phospho-D-threonate 3-dehydrogenase / 4-phospho-D-erythronate 3-dehydrogenase
MTRLLVIADDLTGALECAAVVGSHATVLRAGALSAGMDGAPLLRAVRTALSGEHPVVIDTDSRSLSPDAAAARVSAVLEAASVSAADGAPRLVFKKVDSLLRGNTTAELAAFGAPLLFCPALPAQGRSVVGDVPLENGRPYATTAAWERDGAHLAPALVSDVLGEGAGSLRLPVAAAGGGPTSGGPDAPTSGSTRQASERDDDAATAWAATPGSPTALALGAALASTPRLAVDASDSQDLAVLAAAALAQPELPLLAGSAALLEALHGALNDTLELERGADAGGSAEVGASSTAVRASGRRPAPPAGIAVLVGTPEPATGAQIEALVSAIPTQALLLDPAHPEAGLEALDPSAAVVLVRLDPSRPVPNGRDAARAFAAAVVPHVRERHLVMTGGETAGAVLDALGIAELLHPTPLTTPRGEPVAGLALSATPDGRLVATKPGSYGDPGALLGAVSALTSTITGPRSPGAACPTEGHTMLLPTIGVTMGDAAGVGPEITVAALLDPTISSACRAVVIGDARRLELAAQAIGANATIRAVSTPEEASDEAGVINVINLGLIPEDLPFGQLSAVAGDAAYQYIRVAAELASEGRIQAICTAPLNKEALHLGGHPYPGHTEMLAALTGTPEVSMMLSTPKLKVIHVTTHIGLIDAVAKIEPGLVERTIRRGHEALRGSGIERPKIGVAAINPHAGEGGLFGYGEEAEKIAPGVLAAQAEGIDAVGPLPADTLFFLAGRGDYDLVVAMYHDQGHGPIKVLGIEAGVNITVGLPVPRTSVDHGTAFDIAGRGIVDTRSMVEAMRQAIELAPVPAA